VKTLRRQRGTIGGVCSAVLTPLDADLRPDAARAVRFYRALLNEGCDALNILGTTGEANSVALRDRLVFMEAIATAGLPMERLMIGTGSSSVHEAIELTRAAVQFGFGGTLVLPPFYYKNVSDDGVLAYFAAICDRVDDDRARIYLYHFPQMSAMPFGLPLIARLVAAYGERIAGLKDSSGDLAYARSVADQFPDIDVFPSTEAILREARTQGFAGCISATVSLAAPLAAQIWRAEASEDAQAALTLVRQTVAKKPLIPAVRYLTALLQGDAAWERLLPPMTALGAQEKADLDRELASTWLGPRLR
jgi:4-hydroxy-tetrahydrodipicolinate synthase